VGNHLEEPHRRKCVGGGSNATEGAELPSCPLSVVRNERGGRLCEQPSSGGWGERSGTRGGASVLDYGRPCPGGSTTRVGTQKGQR